MLLQNHQKRQMRVAEAFLPVNDKGNRFMNSSATAAQGES